MDPITALGAIVDVGIRTILLTSDLCKPQNDTRKKDVDMELVATQIIATNLEFLKLHDLDGDLLLLYNRCKSVAEELLELLVGPKRKGRRRTWATVQQAYLGVTRQSQADSLLERLKPLQAQIQLRLAENHCAKLDSLTRLHVETQKMIQSIQGVSSRHPKELGYPWETNNHICVDDGLGESFFLPVDLCLTPKTFLEIITLKFESRNLPGLNQIRRGHLEAWLWDETRPIHLNEWLDLVSGGGGIKLAFVMGTWQGYRRNKCIRCLKPRNVRLDGKNQPFKACTSCGLSFRQMRPSSYSYEPFDIRIGTSQIYRDYKTKSRRVYRRSCGSAIISEETSEPVPEAETGALSDEPNFPTIDLVCKRIIVQWEPIYRIVHRYVYCRCILRTNTPSHSAPEITMVTIATCPRHNTSGIYFNDYGNVDYSKDPYFDGFGGYDYFQFLVAFHYPGIYEKLGAETFAKHEDLERVKVQMSKLPGENLMKYFEKLERYRLECRKEFDKVGVELTPEDVAKVAKYWSKMKDDGIDYSLKSRVSQEEWRNPVTIEVRDILEGKWSGKPHWEIFES
ncbi:hypothetical protein EDB81DRAFT_284783 [Dactylonectria macrodidyma]|uniref:Uncharacterized protein n=1 Tax=Dactylonectria macrodidyma TaxID=307937 RepID=A0A9P9JNB9_9HYPO|nr:hypothetical protein EDB81DRAFT_284783 [Dactylonectria macrodidyma]